MRIYTVHEPPNPPADRQDRAERLRFVRDGFSWTAALFGPLWLLMRGLWLALLLYLLLIAGVYVLMSSMGFQSNAITLVIMAAHVLIGLEADTIERWTLARNRWVEIGTVSGTSQDDCERRFFDEWLPTQPVIRGDSLTRSSMTDLAERPQSPPSTRVVQGGWRSAFPFRLRS